MSITSIDLPAETGWEWRNVTLREWSEAPLERRVMVVRGDSAPTHYAHVPTEPYWTAIPEGTPCEITIDTEDAPVRRLAWRRGDSFTLTPESGGVIGRSAILTARPLVQKEEEA